jgi:hypothetical protein
MGLENSIKAGGGAVSGNAKATRSAYGLRISQGVVAQ